ncbi:MAG: hypothetical protein A2X13_07970 [Bacteroidetes bacterium GWC2_33_15]|nr:MAG: hypothetical protein A2X10_05025 [Bacteroidetes bacterium GWA2_33_15]OFX52682.1 MAG: hypothetical protein A2X13_07970 [Bacteroidetes bacterium GWC2_33_15]OFX64012.1 MAG: hypothetical protein A2X15_02365 [Bacteroidetes bacterium GWB2_32_14]OFX67303.1 MAG: hypothetical protein A2X14_12050 [Bacteroidetes bacterium GWD2_33_33]HAN18833.1 hypothetical protein [Bacteroidales bacterium]
MKRSSLNIRLIITCLGSLILVFVAGCEDYFEYSPYAANIKDSYKNIHKENINNLILADTAKDEIKFAVIADSHYNYRELNEAVANINNRGDIDFVIANGDIADHGYLKEYELFCKQMKSLDMPYLTVIGNHDYRSNGHKIYKQIFGNTNKSFSYNNNLFILFDDVFWESNKTPDTDWLEKKLLYTEQYNKIFVICHIPPYGEQFTDDIEEKYITIMRENNVGISIHGHIHKFQHEEYYNDGVQYLTVESIMDKEYVIITVIEDSIIIEQIKY